MISRTRSPSDRDMEAAASGHVRGRRHTGSGLPKYYTIKAVADALDVFISHRQALARKRGPDQASRRWHCPDR